MELTPEDLKVLKELATAILDYGGYWDMYGEFGCGGYLTTSEHETLTKLKELRSES